MNLGRVFQPSKRRQKREGGASPTGSASSHSPTSLERQRTPRLDRCNATKKVNYCVADLDGCSSGAADGGGGEAQLTRYLEVLPDELLPVQFAGQTSFRISGEVEGEFEALCHSLGLSGPDDFGITPDDWAMSGSTAAHGLCANEVAPDVEVFSRPHMEESLTLPPLLETPAKVDDLGSMTTETFRFAVAPAGDSSRVMNPLRKGNGGGGIKGARPAMLAPPPPISIPFVNDRSSTWEILWSLAPDEANESGPATHRREMSSEEDEAEEQVTEDLLGDNAEFEEVKGIRMGETSMDLKASCSWTSIDDDSSSTTTEGTYVISPVGKLKRNIESWRKGHELGSGSFGTVYEAISDDGFFFAVKEVSLVNEGTNARQCINQLEQEIALLSQFEHENIVQYLGTAKVESKLCIFLELVSQGSLASLYQKYHLRDSHVSAYTRQILNGLKYLHDRNVVHRDIKCANILVDANGSVKLADFGLAKEITKFNALKSCKGSVYWMAPEVVKARRNYGHSADIWSLGCTVLEMLTRQHPFPNLEWTHAFFLIGQGRRPPVPKSLSQDARDFIEQCTQVEPDRRPSASQLLDHPFVKRLLPTSSSASSPMDNSGRGTRLQT